ncbi:hypothetical protein A4X09_0g140 [Tilletia walkeri]|uniref:Protein N-terminal glutamine amidohydrolase n=1 Tax=Tilletia walkeri TaxID=117179 RepID=A0A8X7T8Q0_9BASI|nr:hypothetical protein A4X09_0g140 [Tilletia walkeri]
MSLKHSSSFASLRARFRSKSTSGSSKDEDREHSLTRANSEHASGKSLPSSPSSSLMKRPSFLRSNTSTSSGGGGGGSPSSVTSSSSAGAAGAGQRLSRWADAPPLPTTSSGKKGPEKLPLGYVPPAPPTPSSGGSKPNYGSQNPATPPSSAASRAKLTAAEQGARLRERESSQGSLGSEPPRLARTASSPAQTPPKVQQSEPRLLPGQQQPSPTNRLSRAPPSSASQAIAASQQQRTRSLSQKTPPPAASTGSANGAAPSKVKHRVSITPGKESFRQVQERENRERQSKEFRVPPSPSPSGYQGGHGSRAPSVASGVGGGGYGSDHTAELPYTGYGSGSVHSGQAPARSPSQATRASYIASPSGLSSPSQRLGPGSASTHQSSRLDRTASSQFQRSSIAAQALAAERTRSMYVPGQTTNTPIHAAQMRAEPTASQPQLAYPRPPSTNSAAYLPNGVVQALHSPASYSPASANVSLGSSASANGSAFPSPPARAASVNVHQQQAAYAGAGSQAAPNGRVPAPVLSSASSLSPSQQQKTLALKPFSPVQVRSSLIFNAPAPVFPKAPVAQLYASCYCEENAYRLAQSLLCRPPFGMDRSRDPAAQLSGLGLSAQQSAADAGAIVDPKERERDLMYRHMGLRWAVHVVFASNEGQNVALFAQRAGAEAGRGDGLVIWDYHVFVAVTAYLPVEGMAPSEGSTRTRQTSEANSYLGSSTTPAFAAAARSSVHPSSRNGLVIDQNELAGGSHAHLSKTWIYDYDSSLSYPPEYTVPGTTAANSAAMRNGEGPDGLPPPTPVPFDMYALATLRLNLFASPAGTSEGGKAAQSGPKLPDRLKPKFRIVPAQTFLDYFASDRRHMRSSEAAKDSGEASNNLQPPTRTRRGTVPASPDGGVSSVQVGSSPSAGNSGDEGDEDSAMKAEGAWTKPPPPWAAIIGKSAREKGERNNLFERYVSMPGSTSSSAGSAAEAVYGVVIDAEDFVKGHWTGAIPAVPGEGKAANVAQSPSTAPSVLPASPLSQPVRVPTNGSQASRSSVQPVQPMAPHSGRPTVSSPPTSYRGPPNAVQPPAYSHQTGSNGAGYAQPPAPPTFSAGPQQTQAQNIQPHSSMTAPSPTSRRLPDPVMESDQRTWVARPPPPVPNEPGYAPDPRDPDYQQSGRAKAMPNGMHGYAPAQSYASPPPNHFTQQQQQYHQHLQQQQQQRAGEDGRGGAAGVGANGNARRGGRVESPYFAAYLQASYEARAHTILSPSQTPSSSMPSSPQGPPRAGAYPAQSPPHSPSYSTGPMPMTMGAGSMSLLMSSTAAAHADASSPPPAPSPTNARAGGQPPLGYSAAFMRQAAA